MPRGIKKEVIYSKKGKILRRKKKKRHNIEATSFVIKMYPKNEKWPKISTNIAIFYQKMDIYEGLSEISRPRKALRGQKLNLGQFSKLKDGIGVAKSWKKSQKLAFVTKMYHLTMKWQKIQKFFPQNQYFVKGDRYQE